MRDGTLLFILLQGPQDTFSGVQVPLNISPKFIQIIGTFFPLSYTIIFLRELLIGKSWENLSSMILMFAMINIIIVIITSYVLKYGEYYLRTSGNFDFY